MNNKKIILDLCGGSGAWGKPYKDAGYSVYNITLPNFDITKTTFGNDGCGYVEFRNPDGEIDMAVKIPCIHGILAAPPCTEFSRAKSTKPRDFEKGMETIAACMNIIWHVQSKKKLAFWALENPMGLLRRFLGNPPYTFEQWWFGNDRSKMTDLWGRFNEPKRMVKSKPIYLQTTKGYVNRKGEEIANRNARWYSNASAAERAITPAGFAKAFFKANP